MGGRPVRPRPSVGRTRQKVNELSFSAPRSRQGGVRGVASYLFEKFISPLETISFAPRNMIRETELHPRNRLSVTWGNDANQAKAREPLKSITNGRRRPPARARRTTACISAQSLNHSGSPFTRERDEHYAEFGHFIV